MLLNCVFVCSFVFFTLCVDWSHAQTSSSPVATIPANIRFAYGETIPTRITISRANNQIRTVYAQFINTDRDIEVSNAAKVFSYFPYAQADALILVFPSKDSGTRDLLVTAVHTALPQFPHRYSTTYNNQQKGLLMFLSKIELGGDFQSPAINTDYLGACVKTQETDGSIKTVLCATFDFFAQGDNDGAAYYNNDTRETFLDDYYDNRANFVGDTAWFVVVDDTFGQNDIAASQSFYNDTFKVPPTFNTRQNSVTCWQDDWVGVLGSGQNDNTGLWSWTVEPAPYNKLRCDPITSSSPATSAPPTSAPPTSAPPTSAPPTSAPPTSAPPTSAPPTSAPPTSAPPTSTPPAPSASPANSSSEEGLSGLEIGLIVVVCIFGVALIAIAVYLIIQAKKQ